MKYKVIYLDYNFRVPHCPKSIDEGDGYYTYGFSGLYAREFKKFNPEIEVESWKADSNVKKIYEKEISAVRFKLFPSIHIRRLGDISFSLEECLKKELRGNGKVVFNISSASHLLFYRIAPMLKNCPFITQGHGETTAIFKSKQRKGIKKLFALMLKPIEKRAFSSLDIYYVLDERLKNYLPVSFNKNKAIQQTTGVNPDLFPTIDKSKAREKLGLARGKKYILYVGRLDYTKRVDIFIDVYKEIKQNNPSAELILAGNSERDLLYRKAKNVGAIIYKGIILQTELYKFLNAADVYVLPEYSEEHIFGGIGMLSIQALLCNTPIVGGTLRTLPKEIQNKVGIYADNATNIKRAILKILNQEIHFKDLRKVAIEYFSWGERSLKTRRLYDLLIENYFSRISG